MPNIKYEYVVVGNQVLAEIVTAWNSHTWQWEEIYQINYLYEHDGSAIGFQYFTPSTSSATYLYIRNIQGDVTKIVDQNGNILVRYEYDAYGNILSMTGSHENTLGKHNSLTYRSYKYDREINLYYLNSRYYNPEIGRFISSDGLLGPVGNILGHNMYAYTQNNPVLMVDPSGYCPDWGLVGMVNLSAVIVVVAVAFSVATCGAGTVFAAVAIGAVVGAGVGGGSAAVLGGRVGGTVTNGSTALLAFGIGGHANIAAKGISDSILNHKVSSISNMNRKGQSLAIQQLEGLPQNMGSHVLKGSYRNAFKNYSKTQISSLVNNSSTWLKYGIYSSITSVNLSTMLYYVW